AALLLRQYVHLGQELRVRRDRARLRQHHTALDLLLRNTAEQKPHVVARTTLVQELAEHLNARDGRLLLRIEPDQLNFLANLDDPPLDAARRYRTTTRDREHVLDRHQERLLRLARRLGNVAVESLHQLADLLTPLRGRIQR